MKRKYEEEIAANLERAEASIRAAKDLAVGDYYDFAASRAYYAAFYAATAVLLSEELEFSKHSGVIAFIQWHSDLHSNPPYSMSRVGMAFRPSQSLVVVLGAALQRI